MIVYLLLVLIGLPSPLLAGPEIEPLRVIAVQDGGRLKPLDTFARETSRRVSGARAFGAESIGGLDPTEWLLAMMVDPERWKEVAMVRVTQAELRSSVALPPGRDRFSFGELVGNARLMDAFRRLEAKTAANPNAKLEPTEEALSSLYSTLNLLAGIFSLEAPKLIPPPATVEDQWISVGEAESQPRVRLLVASLLSAYRAGDRDLVLSAGRALAKRLTELSPSNRPSEALLAREVHYNRLKPFRLAWMLYLIGGAWVMAELSLRGTARWALLPVAAGWLLHTYGLVLRTLIAGRAPVTNMYESVVFVAWGAVLFALVLEWTHRVGYAAASAAVLAVGCLLLADSVPIMDGSITPLVPVLRDNFWLTTHVLTISLGYAAFLLATGLAHLVLGLWFLGPSRARASAVPRLLHRSLQAGTFLLAAGTLLGGVWASYAWGRFWGWDPKETWALIALLGYLSLLHARSAGLLRELGMAVGTIIAFLGVLMAWYGVNFVLGTGLHSYGFGSGGSGYAAGFAAVELAIAAAALVVWHRRRAVASSDHVAASARA